MNSKTLPQYLTWTGPPSTAADLSIPGWGQQAKGYRGSCYMLHQAEVNKLKAVEAPAGSTQPGPSSREGPTCLQNVPHLRQKSKIIKQ